jgi:GTP cyclohydrolase IA
VSRDGLRKTPLRMAKALLEVTAGYQEDPVSIIQSALFDVDSGGGLVVVKDIEFFSMCEHHVLPFFGKAHVGYLPGDRVVGLSKLARATDALAKRLQVQERLTRQLAEAVRDAVDARGVAVVTEAKHMCMCMRGASKPGSSTLSTVFLGEFESSPTLQQQFLTQVHGRCEA